MRQPHYKPSVRQPKPKPGTESFLSFPILVALSRRPMTRAELSRTVQVCRATVTSRLRELAALGYIVQRWDYRWMLTVRLVPAEVPLPTGIPGAGVSPGLETEPKLPPLTPQIVPGRNGRAMSNLGASLPKEVAETAPMPVPSFPTPAHRVAHFYHIPVEIEGVGRVAVGATGRCVFKCNRSTPVRYGPTSICPVCARKVERGALKVGDYVNVPDEAR